MCYNHKGQHLDAKGGGMPMKKLTAIAALAMMLLTPWAGCAEAMPALGSVDRIPWAVQCAGAMPTLMTGALAAAGVLTTVSVLWYRQVKKRNERE